jgi:ADP-ribosylglycohydrolase
MSRDHVRRCVASALWSAYGDAVGFISELTDESGLVRRTGGSPLDHTMPWNRRIGGRQGVEVELPAGCYSDDTQLRLAVGRAIGPYGFDVEAFAKIELTVWPSYALGGGRGTKAAAANLAKDKVTWYANTFKGWTEAGGNGAAMRVQPHVWAAQDLEDATSYVPDVIRDSISTHGHPGGIVGAVLHSMFLAHALAYGDIPPPASVRRILDECQSILSYMHHMDEFSMWSSLWEREAKRGFDAGWLDAVDEARHHFGQVREWARQSRRDPRELLYTLDLFSPNVRGSGLLTSIAALGMLWTGEDVERVVVEVANLVGSDTDTIATMAGAIGGAVSGRLPKHEILDRDLIISEADRLARLPRRGSRAPFPYPDLLHWVAPKSQADALVQSQGGLHLLGLGPVQALDHRVARNGAFQWQWVIADYGQTLLVKRRDSLPEVHDPGLIMRQDGSRYERHGARATVSTTTQPTLIADDAPAADTGQSRSTEVRPLDRGINLDEVLGWLSEGGKLDEDDRLGYVVRRVARDGTPEQMVLLLGALRDRLRH